MQKRLKKPRCFKVGPTHVPYMLADAELTQNIISKSELSDRDITPQAACCSSMIRPFADVHEMTRDRSCRRCRWRNQVRSAPLALTSFKVSIGSRRTALAR